MPLSKRVLASAVFLASVAILLPNLTTTAQVQPPAYANFEGSQTNPIRLSADGTRLFAANTANASVSVFDVSTPGSPALIVEIPVGVEPVSVNPRTNDEVWVVNQVSDSVSIVSVSQGIVTDTIYIKDEPMDVVFAGSNQAYVTCSRNNQIAVFDTVTHALVKAIPVFGGSPRALAVSNNGKTVYAAFAISGNGTTIIPELIAPPQPPPTNPKLPPPPRSGLIVSATDPNWTSVVTYKVPDNDVVAISVGPSPAVSKYYSGVGTINLGLAVNPLTGDLFVANTDALNLVAFEPNLKGHFVNNRITRIQVNGGVVTPFDLNPGINYSTLPNPAALATALAQPAGVVFDPGGAFMYVAAFGTDRVAVVDTSGNVLSRIEVALPSGQGSLVDPKNKRGPRGLALNAGAQTLYALNRIANTISIISTALKTVTSEIPVGTDLSPAVIKTGRGFLYDAKLSGNGTASCAGCHIDGDMDHLAWNLGDPGGNMKEVVQNGLTFAFHPMKGAMTTQTLKGLLNLSPFHWRGDKTTFLDFNPAFASLMGGTPLSNSDMSLYQSFVNTILFQPNPNQNLDRTLPATFQGFNPTSGLNDYLTIPGAQSRTCNACHTADPGPGSNRLIRPAQTTTDKQPMKSPQLRNMYQKQLFNRHGSTIDGFGMTHDGQVAHFIDFLGGAEFSAYTQAQKNDIVAFGMCFDTGTAPAVGYTRTLTSANVTSSSAQLDWATLQLQAAAGNIDLIARGTVEQVVHGLLYQPSNNNYVSETGALFTQSQLQTLIQAGDTLTVLGVFPGTGTTNVNGH